MKCFQSILVFSFDWHTWVVKAAPCALCIITLHIVCHPSHRHIEPIATGITTHHLQIAIFSIGAIWVFSARFDPSMQLGQTFLGGIGCSVAYFGTYDATSSSTDVSGPSKECANAISGEILGCCIRPVSEGRVGRNNHVWIRSIKV